MKLKFKLFLCAFICLASVTGNAALKRKCAFVTGARDFYSDISVNLFKVYFFIRPVRFETATRTWVPDNDLSAIREVVSEKYIPFTDPANATAISMMPASLFQKDMMYKALEQRAKNTLVCFERNVPSAEKPVLVMNFDQFNTKN